MSVNYQISSSDRKSLAKQLEDTFDFSPGQARYLSVECYGYCEDVLRQLSEIYSSMESLKQVLKGMKIL